MLPKTAHVAVIKALRILIFGLDNLVRLGARFVLAGAVRWRRVGGKLDGGWSQVAEHAL
ncbi:hypothetical protein PX554_18215 [Sphingomonas sp. H39-1-10]|jgi:hypothetical protein|uniref:hypothetical protein n=1 Tax=Sphingomonadales TaxID=204457 RepID=UPI0018D4DFE3|nr:MULTISPECIES: hypothetical protein [Sphingomonadaceae]MDF0490073.1 hypothetical protein [Sphingomonas pollutisoli]